MIFFRFWTICLFVVMIEWLAVIPSYSSEEGTPEGMLRIPAGPFMLGSARDDIEWTVKEFFAESDEWYLDETPSQAMHLDEYFIDKHEVTVSQYKEFLEKTQREPPKYFDNPKFNGLQQPVVGVSWNDASDYCVWRDKRLPTEAEWEKAARGVDGRRYPWGNDPNPLKANVRGMEDQFRYSAPVGQFPEGQSPFGALDMAGNVFEWTQDWYGPFPGNNQKNDMFGQIFKVIKGGSWKANMDLARSALRGKSMPNQSWNYVGFRCVKESK